jgi:hypothetical protein
VRLYHGTDIQSVTAFLVGKPLHGAIAAAHHIDGETGFYLATALGDAEFFAARRWEGAVLVFELTDLAEKRLMDAGASLSLIPGGDSGRTAPVF